MRKGHKQVFDILRQGIDKDSQYLWFHAASLGEFEQGRPLMERIRNALEEGNFEAFRREYSEKLARRI